MGLLGGVFNFLDPILDTVDPMHNQVQTWTTGSKTTKGQSPYFEAIAPIILDAFLPGVGSAVGAVDKGSNGNWGGSALSALSAYGSLGSAGAVADTGAGLTATEGLASTAPAYEGAGTAAGSGFSGADSFGSLSASGSGVGAANSGADALGSGVSAGSSGVNSAQLGTMAGNSTSNYGTLAQSDYAKAVPVEGGNGWQYYDNGTAISPTGQYYLNGEQITGAGGQQMGLLDQAGNYYDKAKVAMNGVNGGQLSKAAGAGLMTAQKQQAGAQRMPMQLSQADTGGQSYKPAQSFQNISPYSSFSGGYNPQKRRGLL